MAETILDVLSAHGDSLLELEYFAQTVFDLGALGGLEQPHWVYLVLRQSERCRLTGLALEEAVRAAHPVVMPPRESLQ